MLRLSFCVAVGLFHRHGVTNIKQYTVISLIDYQQDYVARQQLGFIHKLCNKNTIFILESLTKYFNDD